MTFGSLFSGIGGIDLGLERAGMKCVWQVEREPHCLDVLGKHWPGVLRKKDVRKFHAGRAVVRPDWIGGGFPCQDLSVAGRRAGLAGKRSWLFYEFARIIEEFAPGGVLIENVPGLLSSGERRDMGAAVGRLGELGYGVAWRVCDAQWWGVAQQRRRVFIVGCAGADVRRAAQILFESESLPWNPAPSREAGQGVARRLANGSGSSHDASEDGTGRGVPLVPIHAAGCGNANNLGVGRVGGPMHTLDSTGDAAVAFAIQERAVSENETNGPQGKGFQEWRAFTLEARHHSQAVALASEPGMKQQTYVNRSGVRRLTPKECLRLQGLPDDWLDGLDLSDSAKYRMIGNSVAVPVLEWIGKRMMEAP